MNLAFQQVLGWFVGVFMGASNPITNPVFDAFSDDVIHSRFHGFIVVCCFRTVWNAHEEPPLPLRPV